MSSKNVDRLSMLPEEITSHILSLMPTKYAVQTSILSKRLRYSWMPITNLNFEDIHTVNSLSNISNFMDWALQFHMPSRPHLFRFHCTLPMLGGPKSSMISSWIDKAVSLNVRELDLLIDPCHLPLSMFTCKSLTKLKLTDSSDEPSVWDLSCPVALPSLRTLDITLHESPVVNAFKIIAGCPILESLSLKVESFKHENDYHFNIPTLKRLELVLSCSTLDHKVVLQVPNLEYLRLCGDLCSLSVMEDLSSLVDASVSISGIQSAYTLAELFKPLSGVEFLSVENMPPTSHLPIFPNTKHLMLKFCWSFGKVLHFLESFPDLKHLYIKQKQYGSLSDWIEPTSVVACLLKSLTTIKFSICQRFWKRVLPFIKYMLGNGEVLERLTITWQNSKMDEERLFYAELVKLPKASKCCEICFNGLRLPAADD